MMKIEHINLMVRDIPESLAFYQAAFPHWQVRGGGEDDWYSHPRKWIHFGDDYHFITLNDNGQGENRNLKGIQVGLAHFGFLTSNIQALLERLQIAGFNPHKISMDDPFRHNAYFIDPDGFEVEFVQYLTDISQQRNRYE